MQLNELLQSEAPSSPNEFLAYADALEAIQRTGAPDPTVAACIQGFRSLAQAELKPVNDGYDNIRQEQFNASQSAKVHALLANLKSFAKRG